MKNKAHYPLRTALSYLPNWFLKLLIKQRLWQPYYDKSDGWDLWMDAAYSKYVRKDKRRPGPDEEYDISMSGGF